LGPERTAYFAIAWTLVAAVFLLGSILVGPFVAEVAANPGDLHHLIRHFGLMLGALCVGSSLFLAIGGPLVLGFVGPDYRTHGAPLLYLAALIIPLWLIGTLYDAVARIHRKLALAVFAHCLLAVVSVGGSALLVPAHGVAGVGIAYLTATAINAILLGGPLIRGFRHLARGDWVHPSEELVG
jgi:O-antigen/teichoic acid export membrane protein